jgi:hypothetical protein
MGLKVEVPWVREWQRPAFAQEGITQDVVHRRLEAPCDRLLALVGRDARDFVWGALMPEILGAVETRTNTKGYVVAETGSLNQVLSFSGPADGAVHEFYHLLGCEHSLSRAKAYAQVAYIKRLAAESRSRGNTFFPAVSQSGRIYLTRAAVDRRFGIAHPEPGPKEATLGLAQGRPRPVALAAP